MRLSISILLLFILPSLLRAQHTSSEALLLDSIDPSADLLRTYAPHIGKPENKITRLIELAMQDKAEGRVLSAIDKIQVALILEKELPHPTIESFNLFTFAANVVRTLDIRYSLEFLKKATGVLKVVDAIKLADVFDMYTNRAGIHGKLEEVDSAFYYFHMATITANQLDKFAKVSSFNNLGVFFSEQMQYDSARYYYQKALDLLGDRNSGIILYCAIQDNLAQLSIRDHQLAAALKTFQYNDSVYQDKNLYVKYLVNKTRLLSMMHQLKLPGIEPMLSEIKAYMGLHQQEMKPKDIQDYYRFVSHYATATGNHALNLQYKDLYIAMADSMELASSEQLHLLTKSLLSVQRSSFTNELKAHELASEKTKLQLQSTRRNLLILLFTASAMVIMLLLYFQKRRQELHAQRKVTEAELREKKLQARLIENELELKKKDLTNVVLHNTQVHDFNQKMIDRLEAIAVHKADAEQQVRSLLHELQSQNQMGDRSLALQANIDSVNEAFYENLKQRFPELTKSEGELCGFIRINLSTKDISILKNVEATSVKMSKNRLRKKLGITPEEDLYAFIKEV